MKKFPISTVKIISMNLVTIRYSIILQIQRGVLEWEYVTWMELELVKQIRPPSRRLS